MPEPLAYPVRSETILNSARTSVIIPVPCECEACHLPFATIENGGLWVQSVHSGQKHRNRVSDLVILQLAAGILLRQMVGGT